MKKQDKKKIKKTVGGALSKILESLKLSKPSKRTVRAISKVSKTLRNDLEEAHRRQHKKVSVKLKAPKTNGLSTTIVKIISKKRAPKKSGAVK
jgi:hypothetical protein